MGSATERVRAALADRQIDAEIVEFPESTRTAVEAARAVGATVAQIVKSLVFMADGRPVLVLAAGANRVDLRKLARLAGAAHVEKATAEATRSATGFSIGGVPPVGHATPLPVFLDETLLHHEVVYAAAGTPHAVFAITPQALVRATQGVVGDLAEALEPR
ncbi:MAG TPA: YbaK/EbsC family protein [bacterium]|nr:YbaK/EbsC family protein [bacterium]